MVKRRGDKTPDPPGGRAAERLRMYLESQRVVPDKQEKKPPAKDDQGKREGRRAKQDRRKD
jgi:hypothetical protein